MRLLRRLNREAIAGADPLGPRIALWGKFEVADFASMLVPRILEHELRQRLPLAQIDSYAPLEIERPTLSLGAPTPHRRRQLANRYDLLVVTGDVSGAPSVDAHAEEFEGRCTVAWSAVTVAIDARDRLHATLERGEHVSVRDEASRERLLAAGAEVPVVPDFTALAARAVSREVLERRLAYLRALGAFPNASRPVLADSAAVAPEAVARRFPREDVVWAHLGEGAAAPAGPYRLPERVTVEDVAAAISASRAVVAGPRTAAVAAAFGVPFFAAPDLAETPPPRNLAARAEAELDALAAIAERSWARRAARDGTPERLMQLVAEWEERYQALATAYETRGDRLLVERIRFGEIVERLEAATDGLTADDALTLAELEDAIFTARAAEAEARFELERLRAHEQSSG